MREKLTIRKIYGRRAVLEALRSKETKVEKIILAKGTHGAIMHDLQNTAQAHRVPLEWMDRRRFDKFAGSGVTQGVVAVMKKHDYADISQILENLQQSSEQPLLVVTDEIEDPRNVGAIARCAEGAGAQGMIITAHRSAEVTGVGEKASGGALQHLPVAQVVNLANALQKVKAAGLWVVGLDAEAGEPLWQADLKRPLALVIGSEGEGLRRLTKESCDMLIKIPMQGKISSLNAAVAAGIVLFEIVRQKQQNPPSVRSFEVEKPGHL
ncbi:23S rRNA (guanosine(2251)-2'-O)-methyltransferase RlmB [bacterium]|nr:23S rRNA (guanosine(2251)-2'-O)-methyltransferase RlmB [bacterium]